MTSSSLFCHTGVETHEEMLELIERTDSGSLDQLVVTHLVKNFA
jgi:hypothetical protein